ncbi:MAG: hypothetical protein DMG35_10155 [Acidobacteria bacterium]|nr:MAG: hypothetical protein DMG35_10155 [Acidobacteriota bacterium]
MTGIGALVAYRNTKNVEDREAKEKLWRAMLLLGGAATILMLRASSILWTLLPELRFLQFSWRWMAILAVPYSYFGAAAIVRRRGAWVGSVVAVMVLASGSTATFLVHQAWWDTDDIPVLEEAIASGQGFEGTDEYDPVADDHYNLPQKARRAEILPMEESEPLVPKAEIHVERWTAEERELSVSSPQPLRLALRVLNYPGWRVEIDGKAVTPQLAETTAQMILPLSAGTHRITVRFGRTTDRTWGSTISMMALLAFLLLASRKQLPE